MYDQATYLVGALSADIVEHAERSLWSIGYHLADRVSLDAKLTLTKHGKDQLERNLQSLISEALRIKELARNAETVSSYRRKEVIQ